MSTSNQHADDLRAEERKAAVQRGRAIFMAALTAELRQRLPEGTVISTLEEPVAAPAASDAPAGSYEWCIQRTEAAAKSVSEWPADMQRNAVEAVATLPAYAPPATATLAPVLPAGDAQELAEECKRLARLHRLADSSDGTALFSAIDHLAALSSAPARDEVIAALRSALDTADKTTAGVPPVYRAAVIGYFCDEWRALSRLADTTSPAGDAPAEGALTGERAAFERAISAPPYEHSVARFPSNETSAWPGNYRDLSVDLAWCMWQARTALAASQPSPQEPAAFGAPKSDDLMTVANIEPINGGNVLTLLANDLGNLIDIVGEDDAEYRAHITSMRRDEFEAMGEFDGF